MVHFGRSPDVLSFTTASSVVGASGWERAWECWSDRVKLWIAAAFSIILDGQEIIVAALAVDPIVRRDHGVRIERGDHVIDDFFLGQSQFGGMHAVDIQAQAGIVHILRNVDLAHAGQLPDAARQVLGDVVDAFAGFGLLTCTSIGAGIPMFRIASTIEPLWKNVRMSGILVRDFASAPGPCIRSCSS